MRISNMTYLTVPALAAMLSLGASAQTVKATINFPDQISGIAVDSVLNRVYVVEPSFGGATDTLAIIDGKKNQVIKSVSVPAGAYLPSVNLLTHRVYIASCNYYSPSTPCFVTVYDAFLQKVLGKISISTGTTNGILGIAVDPIFQNVYVANGQNDVVDVISGLTNKICRSITVSGAPLGLTFNPLNQTLYVPTDENVLEVISTRTWSATASTAYGDALGIAAVNYKTGNVFVTNNDIGALATTGVFDKTGTLLASVPVGDNPYGVDVDPITNVVLVADSGQDAVTEINGATNVAGAPLLGVPANYVAINFATKTGYVSGGTTVTVITE